MEESSGAKVVTLADVHQPEDFHVDGVASQSSLCEKQKSIDNTVMDEAKYCSSDGMQYWVLYLISSTFYTH